MKLTDLLALDRPLIVFDTETTGINPSVDRVVELGFQVFKPDGEVDEWRSLINPGILIPAYVTEVHGITDAHMHGCRICEAGQASHPTATCPEFKPIPRFEQVAEKLAKGFSNCDFAGKRVRFDLQMMAAEFKRAKVEWSYAGAAIICADRNEQIAEPRSLTDLYKKYTGEDLVDAHSALADVRATVEVIVGQLTRHEVLPRDVRALHDLSWEEWIDSEGRFKFRRGVAVVAFGQKYNGVPMREVEAGFYRDFILKKDFSDEVKQIARDALAGKYPTKG